MSYEDLLPDGSSLRESVVKSGMTEEQADRALRLVANWLREHAEYYETQYDSWGHKEHQGAHEALNQRADDIYNWV